ncbi:hypothetical protein B5807_07211 [Epicoccum nigrum]|uniref:Uncharacterized protein n=1 Tax=Epicoccum nigrum TaxID=105696 RepID=A0A1Y2LU94_EPING|nr:hypothetical protein B5807_07211 [Epicoccum nigrum]
MSSGCDPQEAEIAAILEMFQNHRKLNEELSNKYQAKSDRIQRRLKIITGRSTMTSLQASAVRQRDAEIALLEKELQSERENDDLFNSVDARPQLTRDAESDEALRRRDGEVTRLKKELRSQRQKNDAIASIEVWHKREREAEMAMLQERLQFRREKNDRLNRGVEDSRGDDERLRERVRDANKREDDCHGSFLKSF